MLTTTLLALALAPAAHALDHGPWQAVLDAHLDSSSNVDYAAAKDDAGLEAYVVSLATAPAPSGQAEKLAFWMNLYNAWTLQGVLDAQTSDPSYATVATDDFAVFDLALVQVGGVALCQATAHPGQQNVLIGHSVSSGAFEGLALAGEGHAGVQRFDPALKRSRSRLTV